MEGITNGRFLTYNKAKADQERMSVGAECARVNLRAEGIYSEVKQG